MCGHLARAGFDVTAFDLDAARLGAGRLGRRASGRVSGRLRFRGRGPDHDAAGAAPRRVGAARLFRFWRRDRRPGAGLDRDRHEHELGGGRVAGRGGGSERGVDVLDAPVAGQSIGAKAGTLAIYVGGDPADVFERARPLFDAMGDPARVFHLGPNGAGYTVKLLLNLMWFIESVAVGEVLSVGVKAGVPLDRLHEALVGSPANSVFLERDVRMVLDDGDYDEAFPMRLVTKDLGLAVDLAGEVGVPAELTALVEQIHRRASEPVRRRRGRDQRRPALRGPGGCTAPASQKLSRACRRHRCRNKLNRESAYATRIGCPRSRCGADHRCSGARGDQRHGRQPAGQPRRRGRRLLAPGMGRGHDPGLAREPGLPTVVRYGTRGFAGCRPGASAASCSPAAPGGRPGWRDCFAAVAERRLARGNPLHACRRG